MDLRQNNWTHKSGKAGFCPHASKRWCIKLLEVLQTSNNKQANSTRFTINEETDVDTWKQSVMVGKPVSETLTVGKNSSRTMYSSLI